MSFNIQPSGRDCWDGSPSLDAHDQPSLTTLAFHPAKPTVLETELNSGRPEHPSAVSGADHPSQWPASPTDEMPPSAEASSPASSPELFQVDLGAWYPRYLACMQYFLDHSQHHSAVQSLATFLNIRLPFQRILEPVYCYSSPSTSQSQNTSQEAPRTVAPNVCLRTYIRRLIVTAHDMPPVLQAFFGPDWMAGLEGIWKQERINYMFAAKSAGWASTKEAYDILPDEHAPFVRPIRAATEEELRTAESQWSEWLAMEDWMVGPRSPW